MEQRWRIVHLTEHEAFCLRYRRSLRRSIERNLTAGCNIYCKHSGVHWFKPELLGMWVPREYTLKAQLVFG